jgi:hypothetical protein
MTQPDSSATLVDTTTGGPITAPFDRRSRFADWTLMQGLSDIRNQMPLTPRTHYHGIAVGERMSAVRTAIEYIRNNWDQYPTFMQELRSFIERHGFPIPPNAIDQVILQSVLSYTREWAGRSTRVSETNNFDVLRLYTSQYGYNQIFALLNYAFRSDALAQLETDLRSAVFLIELLNIDLFNYVAQDKQTRFRGTVYRGVSLTTEQLEDFRILAGRPVRDRHWAIPLAMMSSSTCISTALDFALRAAEKDSTKYPFLWRIHVSDLDSSLLKIYQERFPSSVVTSICAVLINELSRFPEDEVLLRGPFFQLIRLTQEYIEKLETTIYVMDLVMLTANRDHPTTVELGKDDGEKARKLFGCLVSLSRTQVCKQLAEEYCLIEDLREYEQIYEEQRKLLADLI